MIAFEKPWQHQLVGILKFVIENNLEQGNDVDNRIGYILLDYGVESILKTYLLLQADDSTRGQPGSVSRDQRTMRFPELVAHVFSLAKGNFDLLDRKNALYFHSVRNTLYHDIIGITVGKQLYIDYIAFYVKLLKSLLEIDVLEVSVSHDTNEVIDDNQEESLSLQLVVMEEDEHLQIKRRELFDTVLEVIERIEPRLALPSFRRYFNDTLDNIASSNRDDNIFSLEDTRRDSESILSFFASFDREKITSESYEFIDTIITDKLNEDRADKLKDRFSGLLGTSTSNEFDQGTEFLVSFVQAFVEQHGFKSQYDDWVDVYDSYTFDLMNDVEYPHAQLNEDGEVVGLMYPTAEQIRETVRQRTSSIEIVIDEMRLWMESEDVLKPLT